MIVFTVYPQTAQSSTLSSQTKNAFACYPTQCDAGDSTNVRDECQLYTCICM